MSAFDALSIRDFVALVVIATRTIAEPHASPSALVEEAFATADAFVDKSEGRWANGARANHQAKEQERKKD